jgi:hypothetical protein
MSYSIGKVGSELGLSVELVKAKIEELVYEMIDHASADQAVALEESLEAMKSLGKNDILPDGMAKMLLGDKFVVETRKSSQGGMGGEIAKVESIAHAHLSKIPELLYEKLELARVQEVALAKAASKAVAVEMFLEGENQREQTLSILQQASFELRMHQIDEMANEGRKRASSLLSSLYGQIKQSKEAVKRAEVLEASIDSDVEEMKNSISDLLKSKAPNSALIDILSKKNVA